MILKRCNAIVLIAVLAGATARAQSVGVLLQKGVYQEETAGDLNAAIKTYEKIVADEKANRPHVAQATYRLGMCYLKQGEKDQAVETFEKLIEDFPKQALLIERARGALTVLGHVSISDGAATTGSRLLGAYPSPPGSPRSLAISPDGRYFVFADEESDSLVVRDLRTGQDRQLTRIAVPAGTRTPAARSFSYRSGQSLTISPDGKWVAYNFFDKEDETAELRIIGVDGSGGRVVFDPKEQVRWISPKDWSRDGKQIVGKLERSDGTARIVMVSAGDGVVTELKSVSEWDADRVRLSPDGHYIAYNFYREDSDWEDVALLPVDGGPQIPVTENPGDDILMGWSPDGRMLLFLSDGGGSEDNVWAIQILDGKPQGLAQRVNAVARAGGQLTQDGSYYYTGIPRNGFGFHRNVYIVTLDPESGRPVGHPEKVSKRVDRRTGGSGWSPDGKYLAYAAEPIDSSGGPHWIVIREIKTGHEREIPLKPEFRSMADWGTKLWSPDGGSLFFVGGERRIKTGVCRLDVKTGEVTFAVDPKDGEEILLLGLAPNGKSVFFGRVQDKAGNRGYSGGRILVKNLETGQENEIYGQSAGGGGALAPDGQLLAFKSPTWPNHKSLLTVPTSGGAPQEVLRLEKTGQLGFVVCWTPDSRYLFFAKREHSNGERTLWRIPAQGGQSEEVGLAFTELVHVQFHPNGRQITFTGWHRPDMQLRVLENFLPELTPVQLPNPPEGNYFITRSEDDAEELGNGEMGLKSADLDLGESDLEPAYLVGLRYTDLQIPQGARIKKAYLQFTSETTDVGTIQTNLTIQADLSSDAKGFTEANRNISSRQRTKSLVKWKPLPWHEFGERSKKQQTPNLSSLVQEVVAQDAWRKGNSLVLIITGSGERDAISFDGSGRRYAPMLHVEFE